MTAGGGGFRSTNPVEIAAEKFTIKFLIFQMMYEVGKRIPAAIMENRPDAMLALHGSVKFWKLLVSTMANEKFNEEVSEIEERISSLSKKGNYLGMGRDGRWKYFLELELLMTRITRDLHRTGLIEAKRVGFLAGSGEAEKILNGSKEMSSFPEPIMKKFPKKEKVKKVI